MRYLVWNMTNYGPGYEIIGTYRSLKRAQKIQAALEAQQSENDGWRIDRIEAWDGTDDAKVINAFSNNPKQPTIEITKS